jgi:hypothetical protein
LPPLLSIRPSMDLCLFFRVLILFRMGMLNSLNTVFKFSHITEASFPEFVIDIHYYTSPNQQEEPPTISFQHSESPTAWTYFGTSQPPIPPVYTFSPFHGAMTSRLSPPQQILLDEDGLGYHLPDDCSRSWKTLEQSCRQIITVLRALFEEEHPKFSVICSAPPNLSQLMSSHRGKGSLCLI